MNEEVLEQVAEWRQEGKEVVVATIVSSQRSAPRPIGSKLAISDDGRMCGSVSGGCVESDVVLNAQEVLESGEPRLLTYGFSDDQAWQVGLPCGGEIDVFLEKAE